MAELIYNISRIVAYATCFKFSSLVKAIIKNQLSPSSTYAETPNTPKTFTEFPPASVSQAEEETKKTKIQLNVLQKALKIKIRDCREYERKIANLEKEFDGLKKQNKETQVANLEKEIKIDRLIKMNHQLKEEFNNLKQKMEEKEKEKEIPKEKKSNIYLKKDNKLRGPSLGKTESNHSSITQKKVKSEPTSDSEHNMKKVTTKRYSSVLSTIAEEKNDKSNNKAHLEDKVKPKDKIKPKDKASTTTPKIRTSSLIKPLSFKKQ